MPISSPNPIFDHLLESSPRDDSNKMSNIGFGEEIRQVVSIEVNLTHLIWSSGIIEAAVHFVPMKHTCHVSGCQSKRFGISIEEILRQSKFVIIWLVKKLEILVLNTVNLVKTIHLVLKKKMFVSGNPP